jgi:hypothetical protein
VSDLEQIVRPSQLVPIRPSSDNRGRGPLITPGSKVVSWGSSGSSVFQLQASISQNLPPATWPKSDEEKRTYDVVKVSSADDPDTSITLEAMTSYQARNAIDQSRITLNYAHTQPSSTVTVVSTGNVRTA